MFSSLCKPLDLPLSRLASVAQSAHLLPSEANSLLIIVSPFPLRRWIGSDRRQQIHQSRQFLLFAPFPPPSFPLCKIPKKRLLPYPSYFCLLLHPSSILFFRGFPPSIILFFPLKIAHHHHICPAAKKDGILPLNCPKNHIIFLPKIPSFELAHTNFASNIAMLTNVFVVSSPPPLPKLGRDIAMTISTDLSITTNGSRDSQGPSSTACCAATSAIEGGRRFSELLPGPPAGHQRPPSPFAHEAEATTQDLATNANVADGTANNRRPVQSLAHPQQHHLNRPIREQSNSLGSDGTLSRSLSSPELLQLPFMNSQSATSSGIPAISATPSPLPTNELSLLSPVPPKSSLLNSASTQLNYLSSSSSLQSLKAQQSLPIGHQPIRRPKMQLNGTSILSIDIGKLTKKGAASGPSPLPPRQRHSSGGSVQSDTKRNLISLTASVGNAIQRTKRELQRTRLWHAFYAFALPLYTLAGALIFQALDGDFDDHQREMYERRCLDSREEKMANLEQYCTGQPGDECFRKMRIFLAQVENCYRRWHEVNKTITHPMSDFTNAVIYAFSVYTTIGYGTISASSTSARIATVFYGIFGIPLFFAFIKEEGNACRTVFIRIYNWLKRYCRQRMALLPLPIRKISASACRSMFSKSRRAIGRNNSAAIASGDCESAPLAATANTVVVNCPPSPPTNIPVECATGGDESNRSGGEGSGIRPASAPTAKSTRFSVQPPYVRQCSDFSLPTKSWKQDSSTSSSTGRVRTRVATDCGSPLEQRRVFLCGVLVFCVYLLMCSLLFSMMTGWDYFTAFYFLFNSVALIGFGDVFPKQPRVILVNMFFIVLGVVLFSMCYFILQEEIRVKAFEASRKARTSIAKYSQSLMLHTRPWSRRNSPAFDKTIEHFDRLRKRRQSAPAIALQVNGGAEKNVKRTSSGNKKGGTPPLKI